MDEFYSGLLRSIFRFVGFVLFEFFFGTVCYFAGWPVCRALTLGRYPYQGQRPYSDFSVSQEGWPCSLVGFVTIVVLGLLFAGWLG